MPLVAPIGTVVVISVAETTVNVAGVPLKVTLVVPLRLLPSMNTDEAVLPDVGRVLMNGARPIENLKIVPQLKPAQTSLDPPARVRP